MSNMTIWDKLRQPPQTALKPITAGRLRGKTDINPQWRMQELTEVFGPCGIGWYYDILDLWMEEASGGQKMAFAKVNLFYKHEGGWSKPIPGIGGSMAIAQESSGMHSSDECYKMAVTDALSVAMKAIGMAADIYLGMFDGSKYKTAPPIQMNPDPVDQVKVEKAYAYLVAVIDNEEIDDVAAAEQVQKGWKRLTPDEQIQVNNKLKAIKNGKKQYNTILREYLAYNLGNME